MKLRETLVNIIAKCHRTYIWFKTEGGKIEENFVDYIWRKFS
jgi:hypothetical protein